MKRLGDFGSYKANDPNPNRGEDIFFRNKPCE